MILLMSINILILLAVFIYLIKSKKMDKISENNDIKTLLDERDKQNRDLIVLMLEQKLKEGVSQIQDKLQNNSEQALEKFSNFEIKMTKEFFQFATQLDGKNYQFKESLEKGIYKEFEALREKIQEQLMSVSKNMTEGQSKTIEKLGQFETSLSKSILSFSALVEQKLVQFKEEVEKSLVKEFEGLNSKIEKRLDNINQKVEDRLKEGFEKTRQTFTSVLERLSKIDEAQKKIDSLSMEIVSLQDVLTDKKTRGIFGEVQLNSLIKSVFGEKSEGVYALQYKLSNSSIVDAMLFLPEPLGNVSIDSKFPLENYKRMIDKTTTAQERELAAKAFKINVKKHITDIFTKYIIKNETAGEAFMFVPAEAIFAEIHAYHPDLIEFAQTNHVWIASPTTLMAMLTTVQVLLKNAKREEYAHIIHKELDKLSDEFKRYEIRWNSLSKHMDTVYKDVKEIHITTEKIGKKFTKISTAEVTDIALLEE